MPYFRPNRRIRYLILDKANTQNYKEAIKTPWLKNIPYFSYLLLGNLRSDNTQSVREVDSECEVGNPRAQSPAWSRDELALGDLLSPDRPWTGTLSRWS